MSQPQSKIQDKSLRVIWFLLRQYKLRLLVVLVLSVVVGGLEAANIAAIYPILTAAFPTGAGDGNTIVLLFNRVASLLPIQDTFMGYCVIFLLIALLAFIAKLVFITYRVRLAANLVQRHQRDIFNKLIMADYQYFIDHKQGELLYNVVTAPNQIAILVTSLTELVQQAILSISVLLLLFSLSWQGTIAVILFGLGYYYLTSFLGKRVSYYSATHEMVAQRETNVIINEVITGIKQVKVYGTTADCIDRFDIAVKRRWQHYIMRNIWQTVSTPFLFFVLYLAIGIIALVIKIVAPASYMELIPAYGTFGFAIFRLFPIIGTVGGLTMQIMGALPNCEAVYTIERERITYIEDGQKELSSFKHGIQFEDVTSSYNGSDKVLKDVSIYFKKGTTIAIVGRSGSGKTTVINLLLRLFEPDNGQIKIDGSDIKEYRLSSWLDKIGFVDQDTFILNDTIKNNITFRFAGYSDEDVVKAAKYADIHEFIAELPNGYDTLVGDRGVRLSGGQRQRIAIARAMIREPEILIFDEATNALDSISEAAVQKAIDEISKGHTTIIIAHRLTTIANADKIIVLSRGRVVGEGKHRELMEKRGTYWELYQSPMV
jgi:ABC-type multidrug transport system fused ATPase/permease subunit